uniref:Uncharacterized protein n=1 Tax=Opuntia streptacantha TaxID=393608 RepID=A0A7C8ZAR8_OPUST
MLSGVSLPKTSRASANASALCSLICFINPIASMLPIPGLMNIPISSIVMSVSILGPGETELKYQGDFHADGDSILRKFRFSAPTSLMRLSTISVEIAVTDCPHIAKLLPWFLSARGHGLATIPAFSAPASEIVWFSQVILELLPAPEGLWLDFSPNLGPAPSGVENCVSLKGCSTRIPLGVSEAQFS